MSYNRGFGEKPFKNRGPMNVVTYDEDASGNTVLVGPGGKDSGINLPYMPGTTQSNAYAGGPTPWTRIWGPTEIAALTKSGELTGAWQYVTAQSGANGPAMFRREGAAVLIDGNAMSANYGNFSNQAYGAAAGSFANKTLAVQLYWHRINSSSRITLRIGKDTANYVTYLLGNDSNLLQEGFNTLVCHTSEPIGANGTNASPWGQLAFASSFSVKNGWLPSLGTFSFATDPVGYVAIEIQGVKAASAVHNSFIWLEGLYMGGLDKPLLTIGFDIQTSGLDLAYSTLSKYGLLGYAAVPTANGNPAAPAYLWNAATVARLQSLYNAGWDIIQHSVSHNPLGNYADDGMILSEFDGCREQLIQIGCYRGQDLAALANNSTSNRAIAIAKKAGVQWMRGTGAPLQFAGLSGSNFPLRQGSIGLANQTDATLVTNLLALIKQYGASAHLYTHSIVATASDSVNTNVTVFDAMCAAIADEVAAGNVAVVTPSQFIKRMSWPNLGSIHSLPGRLSIVSGVSPFDLYNAGYEPCVYNISGGTVSAITYSKDGTNFDTLPTAGQFLVMPGDRMRITYTVAPTIIQLRTGL